MHADRYCRAARRCLIGAVTSKGGVVGALGGKSKALGEGDLTVGVGFRGGVVEAGQAQVVIDSYGFGGERRCAVREGGGEGDGLADGKGGRGRGEGDLGLGKSFDGNVREKMSFPVCCGNIPLLVEKEFKFYVVARCIWFNEDRFFPLTSIVDSELL